MHISLHTKTHLSFAFTLVDLLIVKTREIQRENKEWRARNVIMITSVDYIYKSMPIK